MDDPSYIELRTSKDHWTLIRRILKSFKCYIYMSNNSRVKRDAISTQTKTNGQQSAQQKYNSPNQVMCFIEYFKGLSSKGKGESTEIIVSIISPRSDLLTLTRLMILFFLSQQPTTQPGIHFKVTATAAVDLLQHRFNAAVISNPTHSCGTEITAPNMSHHELKWSALSCRYLITK